MGKAIKIWNLLLRLAGLMFLLLGSMLAIQDGLMIDWWRLGDLIWICGLVSIFVTLIYIHWISGLCGVAAAALLAYLVIRQHSLPLLEEAARLKDIVIPLVNRYHHLNLSARTVDWSHTSYDSRYFLLLIALGLSLWIGLGVSEKKLRWLTFLPVAAAYLCGFAVGNAPGLLAIVCLVCGHGICFAIAEASRDPVARKTSLLTLVGLFFVLWIMAAAYEPLSEVFLKNHDFYLQRQLALEDRLLELTDGHVLMERLQWAFGGSDDEARLSMEAPIQGDAVIFEMTVEELPQDPVYVKNFTGARYEDGVWHAEDGALFSGFLEEQGITEEEREQAYSKAEETELTRSYRLGNASSLESQKVVMDIRKREGSTTLWPYFCGVPQDAQCVGDAGIRTEVRRYETFGYPIGMWSFINSLSQRQGYIQDTEEYLIYLQRYGQALAPDAKMVLKEDPEEAFGALQECEYSFDLEPVPAGTDIVADFLFRQKKGYCMHFASAYTLIYQAVGIPARYASGYVVLPGDFRENADGTYTAAVPQYRGHAWMEVYDERLGWFPVEVTPPGYMESLNEAGPKASPEDALAQSRQEGAQGEEEPKEEEEQQQEEPEKDPRMDPKPEEPEEDNQKDNQLQEGQESASPIPLVWRILLGILAVILGLAFLALVNTLRIRRVWRRRVWALEAPDTSQAALTAGSLMLGLLRIHGLRPEPQEAELTFARRVEEAIGWMEPGAFQEGMEILLAARYGKGSIPEGQRALLTALYWRMMEETARRLNRRQQVWYRYFRVKVKK